MGFILNDAVYSELSTTKDELWLTLEGHVNNIAAMNRIIGSEFLILRTFLFSQSTPLIDKTIKISDIIKEFHENKDPNKQISLKLLIKYLLAKSKPIASVNHQNCFDFLSEQKNHVFFSLISPNLVGYQADLLQKNEFTIRNFYSEKQISSYEVWKYEHNKKHGTKEKSYNNKCISKIDLGNEECQKLLTSSIKLSSKNTCYGCYKGNWYIFRCHLNNFYHAYSIHKIDVPKIILTYFNQIPPNAILWQITLPY